MTEREQQIRARLVAWQQRARELGGRKMEPFAISEIDLAYLLEELERVRKLLEVYDGSAEAVRGVLAKVVTANATIQQQESDLAAAAAEVERLRRREENAGKLERAGLGLIDEKEAEVDQARDFAARAAEEAAKLREALGKYGDHRPSCSMNRVRQREGMLVGALEQVVLADADQWEQVRHIARNTLEYRDSVAEAQAKQPRGVCTCDWEKARAALAREDGDGR